MIFRIEMDIHAKYEWCNIPQRGLLHHFFIAKMHIQDSYD